MGYEKLGLKVGLEVHQELDTEHKLFCACPPRLFREDPEYTFVRRLRPSQSELGEVDPAALFEFMRGKSIVYEADRETSCLVEMDEEPPGPLNGEALDICLTFALMTGSRPVDEVHVMRKTVVDGSNTTGFQRTCIVSLGGSVEVGGRQCRLQHVGLEEDAARKIAEEGLVSRYRIDRLGIPLIEATTAPDIRSPREAEEVAHAIGRIFRATGRVRRGLGTIRQDLNVSIEGGALVEIKGVQQLNLISKVVEHEALRQAGLLAIASELGRRGESPSDLEGDYVDVSDGFASTRCRIILDALERGHRVLALKLPGFAGLVGRELCPNRRLGAEMADRARFWGGVSGLFHTDELPGYDISAEEVDALRARMAASERDAVVVVADEPGRCRGALTAVLDRAKEAFTGVPSETRAADPDGTTHYTRPRPGAARMYPETDVVSISITPERLEGLRATLPEMPDAKRRRLMAEYGLNEKLTKQVAESDRSGLFEELARGTMVSPTIIAVALTEIFRSLERDGVRVDALGDETIHGVFKLLDNGLTVKESLPEIFSWLADNVDGSPRDALKSLGIELMERDEVRRIVEMKIEENNKLVLQRGEGALGPLMGMVMGEVRGRARAQDVRELLMEALGEALSSLSEE
ncbi:MAG: Glu-tRNA(Gln) amidotransferase subunit GatE [Candidatus Bathyarchaeota archaeon]|nr:Glu-tRNA(Gln) amidotransferase subunit GatE [Candidatus Bathyarchaeota archaeon]